MGFTKFLSSKAQKTKFQQSFLAATTLSSSTMWAHIVLVGISLSVATADVYLHNPRGSNDRNCERNVNRNNGNRLFDSQNNAKGGYACPRAVGDESRQAESGEATFRGFSQNKKMYYYEGSVLPIEWTSQHGCGPNSKVNCEIILQYQCSDVADPYVADFWPYTSSKHGNEPRQAFAFNEHRAAPRDGVPRDSHDAATDRIPDSEDAAIPDTAEDRRYGMHESYAQYELCQRTERNKGLYTADQRIRRRDMRGTRQNPNGDRRGLECPEERDYYPHPAPSPWIDIAVLTNDAQPDAVCSDPEDPKCSARCKYYLENSFNKRTKSYCDVDHEAGHSVDLKLTSTAWNRREWYNNQVACESNGFKWYNKSLADLFDEDEISYPICARTHFSRVNHLGNAVDATVENDGMSSNLPHGVNANRFLWTIPKIPNAPTSYYSTTQNPEDGMADAYASCALRIRYNVSTSDFPAWPAEALDDGHPWTHPVTSANNSGDGEDMNPQTPLIQDPYAHLGPPGDTSDDFDDIVLSLAVNTNQYSRTFQDRSYTFSIKRRPTVASPERTSEDVQNDAPGIPQSVVDALSGDSGATVYNVAVRGKRGNIVQTYPAVEYDFAPNSLSLDPGDVIHFQWTGSDYNPRRGCNDAEGGPPDPNDFKTEANANHNSRADRNNVVFLDSMAENVPRDYAGYHSSQRDDYDLETRVALSREAILENAPCTQCTDVSSADECEDPDQALRCVALIRRLAFLDQQSDGGALQLRDNLPCLSEAELDAIDNKAVRENHPRNCAKLNAKPFPYFDAGFLEAARAGVFAFFSTRNNNFSNRDQTGILCVRAGKGDLASCPLDPVAGVLQDANPAVDAVVGSSDRKADLTTSRCFDEASATGAANAQGASSCLTAAGAETDGDDVLDGETAAIENKDNDALGDGNESPCDIIYWDYESDGDDKTNRVIRYLTLAIVLFFVGIVLAWATYFLYNRYHARLRKSRKFHEGADWKTKKPIEMM